MFVEPEVFNEYASLQAVFGKYVRFIEKDIHAALHPTKDANNDGSLVIDEYIIRPLSCMKQLKASQTAEHFEDGNRIIAPFSLSKILLSRSKNASSNSNNFQLKSEDEPSVLKIQSTANPLLFTHCAVLEFSAEDGVIYVPNCILNHLQISVSDSSASKSRAILSHAQLLRGTFAQFQPDLQSFFIDIKDCKPLLESALKRYQCLTVGDRICIANEKEKQDENGNENDGKTNDDFIDFYFLEVKQVMAAWSLGKCDAIHIINADIITEFVPAKDFVPIANESETSSVMVDENIEKDVMVDENTNNMVGKPSVNDNDHGGRGKSLVQSSGYGSSVKKKTIMEDGDGFSFIYEIDENGEKTLIRKIPKRKLPF